MEDLLKFVEAVCEGALIALSATKDLVSDPVSRWHHIGLNEVNPSVDLSRLL